jgi:hypothetical protein
VGRYSSDGGASAHPISIAIFGDDLDRAEKVGVERVELVGRNP